MKKYLIIILFLFLGLAASFNQSSIAADDEVVVIVNKNQTLPSRAQLRQIFTGEITTWSDGTPIKVLINNDEAIYTAFANKYLNMSPRNIDSAWVKNKVKYGTPEPRKVNSTIIRTMVSNSTVFIGFLRKTELADDLQILN